MGKRDEERARYRKQQQRKRMIPIIAIIGGAVIIVAILIFANIAQINAKIAAGSLVVNNTMGDKTAPVQVVEFADFQCPVCGTYTLTQESKIISDYVNTGKIFYTYHPFSFIGEESIGAAQAAYCASDQGKFWEYHNLLYRNQSGENKGAFINSKLIAFAGTMGLDSTAFSSCLEGKKYLSKVQQDATDAENLGITSTPTFLVDGKKADMSTLEQMIKDALAAKGK
jgi:protein-disulfide isomerase